MIKWENGPELQKLHVLWEGRLTNEELEKAQPGPGDRYIIQRVRRYKIVKKKGGE